MLSKIVRHAREGTLVKVARTRLRLMANRGPGDNFYGDRAAGYEAQRRGQQYWDDQQRIAEELIDAVPDGSTVLDVPFGTGRFVEIYNRKDMRVSGLEISDDMIRAARDARGEAMDGYDIRVGDARRLPWPDDTFDLVVCYRFIPSIISVGASRVVLGEIARVCRGTALLDLAIRDPSAPQRTRRVRSSESAGVLLYEDEVREMLAKAGLTVEKIIPQYEWLEHGHRCAVVCSSTRTT